MGKKPHFEIVLGTYEEFLLGFKFSKKAEEITQTFATHTHSSSIRCVDVAGGLLASGGSDDRIIIYDLQTRKEHCMLTHHNSTVNCVAFTKERTHLISGSQDGVLAIVRVGNWQLEKIWENAHKGSAILDLAVHDSGKMALSLGADGTLRTWNLIKGRQAYAINLNSKCKDARSLHSIAWAPDGVRFSLIGGFSAYIFGIDVGGILKTLEQKSKICSCVWKSDEQIILGCEDGTVHVIDVESEDDKVYEAHDSRVKCLSIQDKRLISASSSGEIKVWSVSMQELAKTNSGCRFTCICTLASKDIPDKNVAAVESVAEPVIEVDSVEPVKKKQKVVVIVENDKRKKKSA